MAFLILLLGLVVSFVGYVYLDSKQQEVRLTVIEQEQRFITKRLDVIVQRLHSVALRQDKYLPHPEGFEEGGP